MIAEDVVLGPDVVIHQPSLVNIYGCEIGAGTRIGAFVEIRKTVKIGHNVKIQAFVFIPEGVVIEDGVFLGPHVCFTNDPYPKAVHPDGEPLAPSDWQVVGTLVRRHASIGANATIRCGVTIGENAMVGAGSVVLNDVPDGATVAGNPARPIPGRRTE